MIYCSPSGGWFGMLYLYFCIIYLIQVGIRMTCVQHILFLSKHEPFFKFEIFKAEGTLLKLKWILFIERLEFQLYLLTHILQI